MTPRIIGVNGIASNGVESTDALLAKLNAEGFETFDFNYSKISLPKAAWVLSLWRYHKEVKRLAAKLHQASKDGDHIVSHSFGCAVVWHCMRDYGRNFGKVWLVAPAMSIDDEMMPIFTGSDQVTIVHNPYDRALRFGKWLPWVDMSALGLKGFTRKRKVYEPTYKNLPMLFRYLRGETRDWLNHSYAFGNKNIHLLVNDIKDQLSSKG